MLASASASTTSASTEAVSKLLHVLYKNIQLQADSGLLESTNMKIMVTQLLEPLTAEVILEKRVHKAWVIRNTEIILGMGSRERTWYGTVDCRLKGCKGDVLLSCDRETDGGSSSLELKKKVQRSVIGDRVGSVGVFCGENSKW